MTLVVGLGNIGEKYSGTRHNIGFRLIDYILSNFSTSEIKKSSFRGELFRDGELLFLKPSTFMNLSGESVTAVRNFYKVEQIVVIYDDLDLPFGAIRFRVGGGSGGHNGIKSLDNWSRENSIRIRLGIGKPEHGDISGHVLSKFSEAEAKCLDRWIQLSGDAILKILREESWEKVASTNSQKSAQKYCKE
jgi:PTH1 family peptidyl-tRNA hydrolase